MNNILHKIRTNQPLTNKEIDFLPIVEKKLNFHIQISAIEENEISLNTIKLKNKVKSLKN